MWMVRKTQVLFFTVCSPNLVDCTTSLVLTMAVSAWRYYVWTLLICPNSHCFYGLLVNLCKLGNPGTIICYRPKFRDIYKQTCTFTFITVTTPIAKRKTVQYLTIRAAAIWAWLQLTASLIIVTLLLTTRTYNITRRHSIHIPHSHCIPWHGIFTLVTCSCWQVTRVATGTTVLLVWTADSLQRQ